MTSPRIPALLLGSAAEPAPDLLPAGRATALSLGVTDPHVSNYVDLVYRVGNGSVQVVRAVPAAAGVAGSRQWFSTMLPALGPGETLDYRAELRRAGQLLARAPADGSWQTARGGPQALVSPPAPPTRSGSPCGDVRFKYRLEFIAGLTAKLRPEILGETPDGYRINFWVESGHLAGPKLNARIRPEGGDWMLIRKDGVGEANIRITYETDDGALILEQALGVFDIGPDGYAMVAAGRFEGTPPFYATPYWLTAHPNWQWMNRVQGMGFGRVVMSELRVECDIYQPHYEGTVDSA